MILILLYQISTIIEKIDNLSPEILYFLLELSKQIVEFLSSSFPVFLSIAFVTINISLISGAIIYLLDYNEENGKLMIIRSFIILLLLISIFNHNFLDFSVIIEPFEGFHQLASIITSYLLFAFAALSFIIFIGNLGLYLVVSDVKRIRNLKKSVFCLVCIVLPLGFQFPKIPLWKT